MLERFTHYEGAMTIPLMSPRRFIGFFEHLDEIMRGPGPLAITEREFIAAVTSCTCRSPMCFAEHAAIARALGIPKETLDALSPDAPIPDTVGERLAPLARFCRTLAYGTPPPRDQWKACEKAGFDDDAIELAITIVAAFTAVNRLAISVMPDDVKIPDFAPTPKEAESAYKIAGEQLQGARKPY